MSDKREAIIQSATEMIRFGGYNAFSFREIADSVGVKSSSVHHYFRRKEDLATEVAERYRSGFFEILGAPNHSTNDEKQMLELYCNAFIQSFQQSGRACLCGILSHESPALPNAVVNAVNTFIDQNLDWLTHAFSQSGRTEKDARAFATLAYCSLEGAMAVATLKSDVNWLHTTQQQLASKL